MGGFTRLVASEDGKADGLEDEMPSLFVAQLTPEVPALCTVTCHVTCHVMCHVTCRSECACSSECAAKEL